MVAYYFTDMQYEADFYRPRDCMLVQNKVQSFEQTILY